MAPPEMEGYEVIHSIINIRNDPQIPQVKPWNIGSSCSIHRVPKCLRQGDDNAYVPQIVSIGYFHRDDESLQAMNNHKHNYFLDVISWSLNSTDLQLQTEMLGRYLRAIELVEAEAKSCYSEPIVAGPKKFVEIMVLDGCFIIALLCKAAKLITVHIDDPIFKMNWLWTMLQKDLLMLENQIPFIVLQKLFGEMILSKPECPSLASLAIDHFFKGLVPNMVVSIEQTEPKHLLHLFQSSVIPTVKQEKTTNNFDLIQSVKALKEAGIKFKKAKEANSFFDVKFKKGTLEIPPLVIYGSTKSIFLNLVAFEQCYPACTKQFTDYTAFMYCMIESNTDIRTLCKKGIIESKLAKDDEVAKLFQMLGKAVTVSTSKFYLSGVFSDITQYERTKCSACMVSLKRFYFKSYWTIFPFGLALILLGLTSMNAYVAMYSHLHPSPPSK